MVTPFKNVSLGSKDAYNFYQSQVRIRVECSFGMLVHRWAILRKPMPCNYTLGRITSLTHALCKLHNYCIDEGEIKSYAQTRGDAFFSAVSGSIVMDTDNSGNVLPTEISHGGEHSDDFDRRRAHTNYLPRDKMLTIVRVKDLRRPIKLS